MISFREIKDNQNDYLLLHHWCSNKNVYEWFEQRILSVEEIQNKYHKKIMENKQKLLIIQYDNQDIGLVQIYPYEDDLDIPELNKYHSLYEYDLFIGEEEYLSKGIGSMVVKLVNEMIYNNYHADGIILRPFKRNIRAIKCYQKNNFRIIKEYLDKDTLGNEEEMVLLLND